MSNLAPFTTVNVKLAKKPVVKVKKAKPVHTHAISGIRKMSNGKYGTDQWVKYNKKKFSKRIKQLKHIIEDESYIPKGSTDGYNYHGTDGYHEFIHSMYIALISGRKITSPMETSITKVVATYSKTLSPEYQKKKLDYIENTISKLNMIKRRLAECNYTKNYINEKLYFLDSIERQVYSRGSLSVKQRKALNKMYDQFTQRLKKREIIKKSEKKA